MRFSGRAYHFHEPCPGKHDPTAGWIELSKAGRRRLRRPRLRIDEDEGERTEEWRPYATYLISDFFKDMVRNFEQLELVSIVYMCTAHPLRGIGFILRWLCPLW